MYEQKYENQTLPLLIDSDKKSNQLKKKQVKAKGSFKNRVKYCISPAPDWGPIAKEDRMKVAEYTPGSVSFCFFFF